MLPTTTPSSKTTTTLFITTLLLSLSTLPTSTKAAEAKCTPADCIAQGMQPCCGDNFGCVQEESNCVYNKTVVLEEPDFCKNQFDGCYFCCIDNNCKIKNACDVHFKKNINNSYLVFLGVILNLFLALAIYVLFWANAKLRLLNCKNSKLKNKSIGLTDSSANPSKAGSVRGIRERLQ